MNRRTPRARFLVALCCLAASSVAARSAAAAQDIPPDHAALFAKVEEAKKKHLAREFDVARGMLKEVLDADPKDFELALTLARWLAKERTDFIGGVPFARHAVELDPRSVEATNLLGICLTWSDHAADAESVYRAAVQRWPDGSMMHFGLGVACAQQNKYVEGRDELLKALALAPEEPIYHFQLGQIASNLRDLPMAEKEFRVAAEKNAHVDALWRLGSTLAKVGKDPEAELILVKALKSGPTGSKWHAGFELGVFFFERKRYEDAAAILIQATKLRPEGRDAWLYLARAQKALGRNEAAKRSLEKYQSMRDESEKETDEYLLSLIQAQLDGTYQRPAEESAPAADPEVH